MFVCFVYLFFFFVCVALFFNNIEEEEKQDELNFLFRIFRYCVFINRDSRCMITELLSLLSHTSCPISRQHSVAISSHFLKICINWQTKA